MLGMLLAAGVSFMVVAVPVWLIRPFTPQSEAGLGVSWTFKHWSPAFTLVLLVLGLGLVATVWRGASGWGRALALLLLSPLAVTAWFARQNHFEWMFAPLADPNFARVAEADWVGHDEMVLAVAQDEDAAAYPVRQLAYHHLVQDTVGGIPIVATY